MDDSLTKWIVGVVASGIVGLVVALVKILYTDAKKSQAEQWGAVQNKLENLNEKIEVMGDRLGAKIEGLANSHNLLDQRLALGAEKFDQLGKMDSRQEAAIAKNESRIQNIERMFYSMIRGKVKAPPEDE